METEMELRIGAHAECTDGSVGHVRQVIVDQATEAVTYLVVETEPHLGFTVLVPRAMVRAADHERVQLGCRREELRAMEPFEETVFLTPDGRHPSLGYLPSEYLYPGPGGFGPMGAPLATGAMTGQMLPLTTVEEHVPAGGVAFGPGFAVDATDGELGHVQELFTDRVSGKLTHVAVRSGHLFGVHTLVVPADAIAEVASDRLQLRYSRGELEAALRSPEPHGTGSHGVPSPEAGTSPSPSVAGLFSTREQADAVIADLTRAGFPADVISAVTPEGQPVSFPAAPAAGSGHAAGGAPTVGRGIATGAAARVVLFGHLRAMAEAVAGGLAGLFGSLGASHEQAERITAHISSGHVLVMVHTHGQEEEARAIFQQAGATEVHIIRP